MPPSLGPTGALAIFLYTSYLRFFYELRIYDIIKYRVNIYTAVPNNLDLQGRSIRIRTRTTSSRALKTGPESRGCGIVIEPYPILLVV